jgi:hypothetical protein
VGSFPIGVYHAYMAREWELYPNRKKSSDDPTLYDVTFGSKTLAVDLEVDPARRFIKRHKKYQRGQSLTIYLIDGDVERSTI